MQARIVRLALAALAAGGLAVLAASAAEGPALTARQQRRLTPVAAAYRRAAPAVVNISTQRIVEAGLGIFGADDPFEMFGPRITRQVPAISLGSGVLIHPAGYIVTNHHVCARAQKITVTLGDGATHEATIVAANPDHDLAVLKIADAGEKVFSHLPLGRSDDLLIGETVIAIGNPMGLQNTLTTGVVSAVNRTLEFRGGQRYDGLVQIDAPINPGNSGGPLLNAAGELIGINTAIRADAQGIGFAIPVDALAADLPRLLDFQRLHRVRWGAAVERRAAEEGETLVVAAVEEGSPAATAGLRAGDAVVALDGQPVAGLADYQIAMLGRSAGAKLAIRVRRDGKDVDFSAELLARPRPDGAGLAKALFGLELRELTPDLARSMRVRVDNGLVVWSVERGSAAEELGLRRGDVVFQLGRWYISDLERLGAILEDLAGGEAVRVGIVRNEFRAWGLLRARSAATSPASAAAGPG